MVMMIWDDTNNDEYYGSCYYDYGYDEYDNDGNCDNDHCVYIPIGLLVSW